MHEIQKDASEQFTCAAIVLVGKIEQIEMLLIAFEIQHIVDTTQ